MRTKSKYRNKKTDGFDSKKEARRAAELRLLERQGVIKDLRFQVSYELLPCQRGLDGMVIERAVVYRSDFTYLDSAGRTIVEDVKGIRTPLYILKRKLMLWVHDIQITEI